MEAGGRLQAAAVAQYLRSAISSSKRSEAELRAEEQREAPEQAQAAVDGGGGGGSLGTISEEGSEVAQAPVLVSGEDLLAESRGERSESRCGDDGPPVFSSEDDDSTHDRSDDLSASNSEASASASCSKYTVTYECYPEELEPERIMKYKSNGRRSAERMQFIDVLLQPDAYGLGLNIQVERDQRTGADVEGMLSPPPRLISDRGGDLVVVSFRRLHAHDIGPAEATRQIRRGDILHSVDGEEVHSWQHLLDIIAFATNRGGSNQLTDADAASNLPFLLLRFLRRQAGSPLESPVSTASLSTSEAGYSSDADTVAAAERWQQPRSSEPPAAREVGSIGLRNAQHVAMLVRELATKNQALQEALMASRLKQEEQRVHLEQLYALYAKTQLDNSPLFALPKASLLPFARRSPSIAPSLGDTGGFVAAKLAGASVGAKGDTTAKLHVEIELAVRAEQERLRHQYQLQLSIERREAAARHQRELEQLRAAMDKKLEMLDAGLQEALRRRAQADAVGRHAAATEDDGSGRSHHSVESCSCGTWLRLQQELSIHKSLDHDDSDSGGAGAGECLVCNLLTDARRASAAVAPVVIDLDVDTPHEGPRTPEVARVQRVLELLREYEAIKEVRTQRFGGAFRKLGTADPTNPLQP